MAAQPTRAAATGVDPYDLDPAKYALIRGSIGTRGIDYDAGLSHPRGLEFIRSILDVDAARMFRVRGARKLTDADLARTVEWAAAEVVKAALARYHAAFDAVHASLESARRANQFVDPAAEDALHIMAGWWSQGSPFAVVLRPIYSPLQARKAMATQR
ncbi:hypothetical protein H9P43_006034 [Blastocladiella emersonii ATCC 22665]|nr:hypothetical protein H9P43_006034 [Blastocladiella emersonii ATCC 22665]